MTSILDREPIPDLPPPLKRKRLRERFGITQEEIATEMGVTPRTIRRWETGASPVGHKRVKYAEILNSWQVQLNARKEN